VTSQSETVDGGAFCPGISEQVVSVTATGTVTFNADMTYSDNYQESVSVALVIPQSCLTSKGVTCSQVTPPTTCTTSGSDCDCTTESSSHQLHTGTYSLNGNTVTFMPSGGTPITDTYCIQGNTGYVFRSVSGGGASASLEFVATKQ
jgi:hypothetical protein